MEKFNKGIRGRWYVADKQFNWDAIQTGDEEQAVLCSESCTYFIQSRRNDGRTFSSRTPNTGRCTAKEGTNIVYASSSICIAPESKS